MKKISHFWSILRSKPLISGVVIIIVLIGGYFSFFNKGAPAETFTVTRGDFLQQVSVSGKVVAAHAVDLGFAQGGRVLQTYVKVGQYVGAGTLLAEVENGDLRAARDAEEAKLAALKVGPRPEQVAVSESAVAQSESALAQANTALWDAIQNVYTASDNAVHNTLDQFITNPTTNPKVTFMSKNAELASTVEGKRRQIEGKLVSWHTNLLVANNKGDLSSLVQETQAAVTLTTSLLSDANTLLNAAISSGDVEAYVTAVSAVRTSLNTSSSAFTGAVGAYAAAGTALDSARKNLSLAKAGATPEDIAAQEARVRESSAQLQKTFITAPFSGIVTVVDAKAGKIVSPNTPEVSLISQGAFQIESYVPEINVALLTVLDKATVTLDAYGEDVPFEASLVSVDPANTLRDGVSTYRAMLQFLAADPRIKSGMTANVTITTDEKHDVMAIPQGLVTERDGKKYVKVMAGEQTEEREVTTGGVSSLGSVEILSGLSEGDVLPLLTP